MRASPFGSSFSACSVAWWSMGWSSSSVSLSSLSHRHVVSCRALVVLHRLTAPLRSSFPHCRLLVVRALSPLSIRVRGRKNRRERREEGESIAAAFTCIRTKQLRCSASSHERLVVCQLFAFFTSLLSTPLPWLGSASVNVTKKNHTSAAKTRYHSPKLKVCSAGQLTNFDRLRDRLNECRFPWL